MLKRPFSASGKRSEMSRLVGEDMDIKLELLETITEKFSEALKVGGGGYGNVYRVRHTTAFSGPLLFFFPSMHA